MSNPATFWAAKSTDVKSSQTPAQGAEPAPARVTPKTSSMALNGKPSSSLSNASADDLAGTTNGVKKSNWADSDDEEESMVSFNISGRMKELQKTLFVKDTRIMELTTTVQEKDARIIELESALEGQKQSLACLQTASDTSAAHVAKLQKENHKQALHVQKLVAEVDEKDRRIAALESEDDKHCATIAELDVGDNSTQVSSHDSALATEAITAPAKTEVVHEATKTNKNVAPVEQTATKAANTDTESVSLSAKTFPTKTTGPAPNLSAFRVFATSTTVKNTTPPPPAPKLKMPVDLSKFAKKPAAKRVASKKKVEATLNEAAKDGPAPTIDPTSDIRTKHREERALFANGPKVKVKIGEKLLTTLPKYVLMQTSHKAFKYLTDNSDTNTFVLPADSMNEAAAKAHLEWMEEMTYQVRVYSITLYSDEKFDDKNLQICRAARVLGLNNTYVGHFTKIFCDRIRSNAASYEFLDKIATLAYPENDPLYDCLANNLASLRARKAIKNPAEFEALLTNHTSLKGGVDKIEERMRKKQEGAQAPKGPKVVNVGKRIQVLNKGL
ncbi:hypothetical protein N0V86_007518 [Didymella sp. IMI 355093]|nr:hypothetical protein N0V86_007518 [Didymella sp. IMI 355093]